MTTPLNLIAKAERGLQFTSQNLAANGLALDAQKVIRLSQRLKNAIHFQLPEGGRILDNGVRGLRDMPLRLPFPAITVQYEVIDCGQQVNPLLPAEAPRRVGFAHEHDRKSFEEIYPDIQYPHDREPIVVFGSAYEVNGVWIPSLVHLAMPTESWEMDVEKAQQQWQPLIKPIAPQNPKMPATSGWPLPFMRECIARREEKPDLLLRILVHDVSDETNAILELCEALSCVNVGSDFIQRDHTHINRKRIAKGKLPLYETRVLNISVPHEVGVRTDVGGTHASPRQHLRRGHIKRVRGKNYWWNAHVVGSHGRIDKSYAVKV